MLSGSWKKFVLIAIKIGVSAGILTWLFVRAYEENQFAEIAARPKKWEWLTLAFLLCLTAHVIGFYRWKILVRAIDIPFTNYDAVRIGFIGLFFGLFAFGVVGGDTLRIYYASRHARNRLAEVMCSVFADRAIGMLTLFSIATIGFVFIGVDLEGASNPEKAELVQFMMTLITFGTIVGWIIVVGFLFSPPFADSRFVTGLKQLPRVGGFIRQLADAVLLYRRRLPTLLFCVGLSVVIHLCFVVTIYLTAVGIDVTHPPLSQHLLIGPISMAANALPLPGGLGGMELMLSFFYDAMSTESSETSHGIVVAFTFRLMLLMLAVFGAVAWLINRKQIRTVVQQQGDSVTDVQHVT
jgi:uncharacterized protein (TIRG00374 family)